MPFADLITATARRYGLAPTLLTALVGAAALRLGIESQIEVGELCLSILFEQLGHGSLDAFEDLLPQRLVRERGVVLLPPKGRLSVIEVSDLARLLLAERHANEQRR